MIPNKTVTVRPDDKPWYNNDLRTLCRKKNRLYRQFKKTKTPDSWRLYTIARNQYTNDICAAKEEFEQRKYDFVSHTSSSNKKWWSIILLIQRTNDAYECIPPIHVGDQILTDDKDKATAFNNFFLTASTLDDTNMSLPPGNQFFQGGLEFIDITHQDVQDQLNCLDTSKSYGPYMILPHFLKEGRNALTNSLLQLFTMSLRLSKVPKIWKQANVVPIHKKNDQNLTANYRPVSLLSVVVKVFERIIFKYVFNFFRENFVITIFQSRFLPGMSTVTQLLEVYHYFCSAVDEGKEIRVVFLDITKAFDRVWHKGLIYKLKRCGIHGRLLAWFADYLNERLQ